MSTNPIRVAMNPIPTNPYAFQARIMAALIGDIADREATTFARLDALRELTKQSKGRECGLKSGSSTDQ